MSAISDSFYAVVLQFDVFARTMEPCDLKVFSNNFAQWRMDNPSINTYRTDDIIEDLSNNLYARPRSGAVILLIHALGQELELTRKQLEPKAKQSTRKAEVKIYGKPRLDKNKRVCENGVAEIIEDAAKFDKALNK